jgi:hypothetical protein
MPEWWSDLPIWLRYGVALGILGVATGLWFAGIFAPWVWGFGAAMLFAAMAFD